ncbi:mucin 5B, oligomeric mucus gel-forming [Mycoblastus sanguinarius]|nr:mucin 5B, oligomeric mucus gel-forming [Mycoblastus sanguinarius]
MAFNRILVFSILVSAFKASAQTTCTTLQPVFELPLDATSTDFASTVIMTSSLDCGGCSLEVSTFRALLGSTVPSPTTTTTEAVTTSASFVCSSAPVTTTTTSSTTLVSVASTPGPTASPLPPVSSTIQTFIDELSTAILYAELFSNGGDAAKLCSVINPSSLDEIKGPAINGSAVQQEVCALAAINFESPSLSGIVVSGNQVGVSYLLTALYAIQVAGNFAGGTNLATLCSEIEATLIDNLFIGYVPSVGTAVKDYVCSAASSSVSAPSATSAPYPANSTTPTCTTPAGSANTVVPAPVSLATSNFEVSPTFTDSHSLFVTTELDTALPEAEIALSCLDQCIAYQPNATTGPCLSFNVNLGKPVPPTGNGGPTRWFCSGFDAYLTQADFVGVDTPGSYMFGLNVNRVCNGSYRAY